MLGADMPYPEPVTRRPGSRAAGLAGSKGHSAPRQPDTGRGFASSCSLAAAWGHGLGTWGRAARSGARRSAEGPPLPGVCFLLLLTDTALHTLRGCVRAPRCGSCQLEAHGNQFWLVALLVAQAAGSSAMI